MNTTPGGIVGAIVCVVIELLWIVFSFAFSFLPEGLATPPSTVFEIIIGVLISLAISTMLYLFAAPWRREQVVVSVVEESERSL